MGGGKDEWVGGGKDEWVGGGKDEWVVEGRMSGWVEGRMSGWKDGSTEWLIPYPLCKCPAAAQISILRWTPSLPCSYAAYRHKQCLLCVNI